jgi:hypothetical protein
MSGDTVVWRYLTLSVVIATIKKRQLRLTRLDRFKDRFEGSVPKKQIDGQILLLAQRVPTNDDDQFWDNATATRRGPMDANNATATSKNSLGARELLVSRR